MERMVYRSNRSRVPRLEVPRVAKRMDRGWMSECPYRASRKRWEPLSIRVPSWPAGRMMNGRRVRIASSSRRKPWRIVNAMRLPFLPIRIPKLSWSSPTNWCKVVCRKSIHRLRVLIICWKSWQRWNTNSLSILDSSVCPIHTTPTRYVFSLLELNASLSRRCCFFDLGVVTIVITSVPCHFDITLLVGPFISFICQPSFSFSWPLFGQPSWRLLPPIPSRLEPSLHRVPCSS
jgi:hypothetical protein